MLRGVAEVMSAPDSFDCAQPRKTLDAAGLRVQEAAYRAAAFISAESPQWARLCLTLEGAYQVCWGRMRLTCGPAALVFQAPGEAYGAHISDAGSLCLTVDVDPAVIESASDTQHDFERFNVAHRPPPHWLAFQLRRELELADDQSAISVAETIVALLAELDDRPALEVRSAPAPWLERVREQIDDEFSWPHTLESLARTAGVHHVHLARDFRRRFGCTVGHYIRQRRVEFACHQLTSSWDPLSEIALGAGFADQSHFTNTFRLLVGMTPGVFRARFFAYPGDRPLRS